jgi:hypothetical protein
MCPERTAVILNTWPTTLAEPKSGSGNSAPHGLGAPRVRKFGLPKIEGLRIRGGTKKELRSITPPERHRPPDPALPCARVFARSAYPITANKKSLHATPHLLISFASAPMKSRSLPKPQIASDRSKLQTRVCGVRGPVRYSVNYPMIGEAHGRTTRPSSRRAHSAARARFRFVDSWLTALPLPAAGRCVMPSRSSMPPVWPCRTDRDIETRALP